MAIFNCYVSSPEGTHGLFFTHYQSITNLLPLSPVHLLGYRWDFKMIHWDNGINGDLMGYFSGIDPPVKCGKLEDL